MLETLTRREKGALAEDRAFQIYGGIKHPNLHGTIPDLQRKDEFIEVKYIDLGGFSRLQDRLCQVYSQLTKRKKFLPKGATQRVYILFDNPEAYGWGDEELMETVSQRLEGIADSVDIEVLRDAMQLYSVSPSLVVKIATGTLEEAEANA